MSLRDTILKNEKFQIRNSSIEDDFTESEASGALNLRILLHDRLLKTIDLKAIDAMSEAELKPYLKKCIEKIIVDDTAEQGEEVKKYVISEWEKVSKNRAY